MKKTIVIAFDGLDPWGWGSNEDSARIDAIDHLTGVRKGDEDPADEDPATWGQQLSFLSVTGHPQQIEGLLRNCGVFADDQKV